MFQLACDYRKINQNSNLKPHKSRNTIHYASAGRGLRPLNGWEPRPRARRRSGRSVHSFRSMLPCRLNSVRLADCVVVSRGWMYAGLASPRTRPSSGCVVKNKRKKKSYENSPKRHFESRANRQIFNRCSLTHGGAPVPA